MNQAQGQDRAEALGNLLRHRRTTYATALGLIIQAAAVYRWAVQVDVRLDHVEKQEQQIMSFLTTAFGHVDPITPKQPPPSHTVAPGSTISTEPIPQGLPPPHAKRATLPPMALVKTPQPIAHSLAATGGRMKIRIRSPNYPGATYYAVYLCLETGLSGTSDPTTGNQDVGATITDGDISWSVAYFTRDAGKPVWISSHLYNAGQLIQSVGTRANAEQTATTQLDPPRHAQGPGPCTDGDAYAPMNLDNFYAPHIPTPASIRRAYLGYIRQLWPDVGPNQGNYDGTGPWWDDPEGPVWTAEKSTIENWKGEIRSANARDLYMACNTGLLGPTIAMALTGQAHTGIWGNGNFLDQWHPRPAPIITTASASADGNVTATVVFVPGPAPIEGTAYAILSTKHMLLYINPQPTRPSAQTRTQLFLVGSAYFQTGIRFMTGEETWAGSITLQAGHWDMPGGELAPIANPLRRLPPGATLMIGVRSITMDGGPSRMATTFVTVT